MNLNKVLTIALIIALACGLQLKDQ